MYELFHKVYQDSIIPNGINLEFICQIREFEPLGVYLSLYSQERYDLAFLGFKQD